MEPGPGTYARRLSKATTAAAAAPAGAKMLEKFNIENTNAWVTMNAKLEAHKLCTRDPIIGPGRQAASTNWITNRKSPNTDDMAELLCNYKQYEKSYKPQAPSCKPQATSFKPQADRNGKCKPQAPSSKLQAPSRKRQAPGSADPHKVSRRKKQGA